MFHLLSPIIEIVQPFLVPICFACAWILLLMVASHIWGSISTGVTIAKQMHQIPCANCQFFTNDHRLKCPVNPLIASSEDAIGCLDYRPKGNIYS